MVYQPKEKEAPSTPAASPAPAPAKPRAFEDGDLVTVLFGYGKVAPTAVSYIDQYQFVGGVGRNIAYLDAKHWQKGTRPDGKPVVSRVKIQAILPHDATETDFAHAVGAPAPTPNVIASQLSSLNIADVVKALKPEEARELLARLELLGK